MNTNKNKIMSNDSYKNKKELASELIKKAIIIRESRWDFKNNIDPIYEMSHHVGLELVHLLENSKEYDTIGFTDWGFELYKLKDLMKSLLVLLATPGVLEKLDSSSQEIAAIKIDRLHTFFTCIEEGYILEWLNYMVVTELTPKEDFLDMMISNYDFKSTNTKGANFFSFEYKIHKERYEKMGEAFVRLNSKELLSGK